MLILPKAIETTSKIKSKALILEESWQHPLTKKYCHYDGKLRPQQSNVNVLVEKSCRNSGKSFREKISRLIAWSDEMSAQFRSHFMFPLLAERHSSLTNPFPGIAMKSITEKDRWMT